MNPILQTAAGECGNQDRGAVITSESRQVLVVADGAGGTSGGAEAATMAVEFVRKQAPQLTTAASCAAVLQEMDQRIARDPNAGETTCALAVATADEIFGASVGDSGVWVIGESGSTNLTQHQSRKPFIGSGCAMPTHFAERRVGGTTLLLATDGLLKYASSERIVAVCRQCASESDAKRLMELVRYTSGTLPDDVTFILMKL